MLQIAYAFYLLAGLVFPVIGIILPELSLSFATSTESISFISTLMLASFALSLLGGANLIDKLGNRGIMIGGPLFIMAGSILLSHAAPLLWLFGVGALLIGLGAGLSCAWSNWYVMHTVDPEHRGAKLSTLNFFFAISAFGGPLLIGAMLAGGLTWQVPYIAVAILASLALVPGLGNFGQRELRAKLGISHDEQGQGLLASVLPQGYRRYAIFLAIAMFFYVFGEFAFTFWIVSWGRNHLGLSVDRATWLLSAFWLTMSLGRLLTGILLRRMGTWAYLFTGLGLGLLSLIVSPLVGDFGYALGVSAVLGFAVAGVYPAIQGLALAPLKRIPRTVLTVFAGIGPVGGMVGLGISTLMFAGGGLEAAFGFTWVFLSLSLLAFTLGYRFRVKS